MPPDEDNEVKDFKILDGILFLFPTKLYVNYLCLFVYILFAFVPGCFCQIFLILLHSVGVILLMDGNI